MFFLCDQLSLNKHGSQANIWTRDVVCPPAWELTQANPAYASLITLQNKKKNKFPLVILFEIKLGDLT